MFANWNCLLWVDLSSGEVKEREISSRDLELYIGGRGLASWLIYSYGDPRVEVFSPKNLLVLAPGPWASTKLPGGHRTVVVSKSPLTGGLGETNLGGTFGQALKGSGYDALIITGQAEVPVYLEVSSHKARICSAKELWGLNTFLTEKKLLQICGLKHPSILCIGPAGENLVHYASLSSQVDFVGGRLGMGAVMGAKKLKAIVAAKGSNFPPVAEPRNLSQQTKEFSHELAVDISCQGLSQWGTWNNIALMGNSGIIPTRNFTRGCFSDLKNFYPEQLSKFLVPTSKHSCPYCPIACRRNYRLPGPEKDFSGSAAPGYESVAALGPLLLNGDVEILVKANELCNLYGLDTISTGVCLAFLMEAVDEGILDSSLDFPVNWGQRETILEGIKAIAYRQGIGQLLAEGVKKAAAQLGEKAALLAMEVKGLEVAMHDPRGKKGVGLSYATCHKGADHMEAFHDELYSLIPTSLVGEISFSRFQLKGKEKVVRITQDYWGAMVDSLVACKFHFTPPRPLTPKRVLNLMNVITGKDWSLKDYLTTGERINNLCRLYNLQAGISKDQDCLPFRFTHPLEEGGSKGETILEEDLKAAVKEYYHIRGWDEEGYPTKETLNRLEIEK